MMIELWSHKSAWSLPTRAMFVIRGFVVMVFLGCLTATPTQAQIGTPVDLGSNQVNVVATNSLTMTTSATAPAGASVIVMAVDFGISGAASSISCADSAGNSYATDVSLHDNLTLTSICSTHHIAATLPSGSTITVTWSGQALSQNYRLRAFAVTGLASAPLDQTAAAHNLDLASNPPSSGTVTTTQASELLVGAISADNATASDAAFTPGSGYTALTGVGTTSPFLFGEYQIVSATGTYAATGSFSNNQVHWLALLATYKAAPVVVPSFDTCLKDNSTGNLLQWNSTTGQYKFTRCSDGFMLTGTGTVGLVNGIKTLTDFKSDRRLSAGFNTGQLTGSATIYLQVVQGVWQTFRIVATNPSAICSCGG